MKITLAVDGTNRIHTLWHVHHDSRPVVEKFGRELRTLREVIRPATTIVAWDSDTCFRRAIEPSYKLGRAAKEASLRQALGQAQQFASEDCFSLLAQGFEADDLLATTASESVRAGMKCVIVSPDKDLRRCLIADRVSILKSWKRSEFQDRSAWITASSLESDLGIGPDRWIDYQCLVGDSTDNVVGAKGIGDKIARKLLFEAGSIARLLENRWLSADLAKSERLWQSLKELESRLPIVRQLVTLRTDVPGVAELLREGAIA